MKGHQKTTILYVLQGSTITGDAAVASRPLSEDDIMKLWHMSKNNMLEFSRRGLLDGQKQVTVL